jgi:hypothetical protein
MTLIIQRTHPERATFIHSSISFMAVASPMASIRARACAREKGKKSEGKKISSTGSSEAEEKDDVLVGACEHGEEAAAYRRRGVLASASGRRGLRQGGTAWDRHVNGTGKIVISIRGSRMSDRWNR